MGTVRDLITAALLDLGAIASGETPTADEAADCLRRLNLLLETLRLESLMVYAVDTVTKATTGAASYTWGTGGDINSARPVRLDRASLRLAGSTALDYPLQVLTDEEYESIGLKSLSTTLAGCVYLDRAYPLANLYVWPVQASGATLVLYPWHPLTAFASLDTSVSLPPGYELMLQTNLTIECSAMFRDSTLTPALLAQAARSKALIKQINSKARFLTLPAGIPTGRHRGVTSRQAFLAGGNA